jgi:Spy/CpxP family protein refolding chaperone
MQMNRFRKVLVAALAAGGLAVAVSPASHAQPGPDGMRGMQGGGMRGEGFHGGARHGGRHGGHGEMRAFRHLDLTEAQRDQIFKIHHDQAPAFREQMKKVRAARESLQALARAERLDDAALRRAADAQAKAMADLAVMRAQTANKVRAVLTAEQKSKLDQLRERRRS